MSYDKKDMRQFLKDEGYEIVRTGKHHVFQGPTGHKVSVPNGSKMNPGLFKNIVNVIRREKIRYEEETFAANAPRIHNEKHAGGFKNTPRVQVEPDTERHPLPVGPSDVRSELEPVAADHHEPVGGEVLKEETKAMKKLTDEDLPRVKQLFELGVRQNAILAQLVKEGYVGDMGSPLTQSQLSVFMRRHGMQMIASYTKAKKPAEPKAPPPAASPTAPAPGSDEKFLELVEDIMTSNLAPRLKVKFLKALFEEHQ